MTSEIDDSTFSDLWHHIAVADVMSMVHRARAGHKAPMVGIAPYAGASEDVIGCIKKLEAAFLEIRAAGYIQFSHAEQLQITGCLWRYLDTCQPSVSAISEKMYKDIVLRADALASLISRENQNTLKHLDECFDLPELEGFLRELATFTKDVLLPRKKPGAPGKRRGQMFLICELARVFRNAGGRVSASWSPDGDGLSGSFPAFLSTIWETLPSHARPPTSTTFARLARQLPADLRGQESPRPKT